MQDLIFGLAPFRDKAQIVTMKTFPLNLDDLVPKEVTFTLSNPDDPAKPGPTVTLCRWSLRVRAWATAKYTSEGLREIFEKLKIDEIADMAFFMVKDKTMFKDKDAFLDAVITVKDQVEVIKALLGAVGIGEPEIGKITKAQKDAKSEGELSDPKPKAKPTTGAKSTTR